MPILIPLPTVYKHDIVEKFHNFRSEEKQVQSGVDLILAQFVELLCKLKMLNNHTKKKFKEKEVCSTVVHIFDNVMMIVYIIKDCIKHHDKYAGSQKHTSRDKRQNLPIFHNVFNSLFFY